MKRFNILSLAVFIQFFYNCSSGQKQDGNPINPVRPVNALFEAQPGWDIYKAGSYRYGPSIIINADGSIDAWFAAPGDTYNKKLYPDGIDKTPIQLTGDAIAAQKFTAANPFYGVGVVCPSWGNSIGNLTLTLYKWNIDYTTTVKGSVLASKIFVNFKDNEILKLTNSSLFPATDYLWALSKPSEIVGVWKYPMDKDGETNFLNGAEVSGAYEAVLFLDKGSDTGITSYWDQVAYRRSSDGGKSWSADQMVLKPTKDSRDQLSVCDPGVARWGNYYFIGYTSTEDTSGKTNHVYVCRSQTAVGPWEKWNGSGWGGSPKPIITYTGSSDYFGAGEPCMVVKDNKIFFYYSWNGGNNETITTRVATANEDDPNWPAHLSLHGTAINKSLISGADHCDVKYRDDIKKFQAVHTASRITAESYIVLWVSSDGLNFEKSGEIRNNLRPYLHNCGWSSDEKGHINTTKQNFISYAYGPKWAAWNTFWNPISF